MGEMVEGMNKKLKKQIKDLPLTRGSDYAKFETKED